MIDVRSYVTPGNPVIREIAGRLGTPEACYLFVRDNISKSPDIWDEWESPEVILNRGWADCEDHAHVIVSLLRCLGVDARVYIFFNPDRMENHAIVKLFLHDKGDTIVLLDATCTSCPFNNLPVVYDWESHPVVMYNEKDIVVYDEERFLDILTGANFL